MDTLLNIDLGLQQAAEAIGCSPYAIDKLFKEGRTGELVRNTGSGAKVRLKVRVSDLDDLKSVVEEHSRRQRQVRTANGEVIMNKLDALARAVHTIVDKNYDASKPEQKRVYDHVTTLLVVGGFDIDVVDAPVE